MTPCSHSSVIAVDQSTGEVTGEPFQTLSAYRLQENGLGNHVRFGQNCIHQGVGKLSINDELVVLEWK